MSHSSVSYTERAFRRRRRSSYAPPPTTASSPATATATKAASESSHANASDVSTRYPHGFPRHGDMMLLAQLWNISNSCRSWSDGCAEYGQNMEWISGYNCSSGSSAPSEVYLKLWDITISNTSGDFVVTFDD